MSFPNTLDITISDEDIKQGRRVDGEPSPLCIAIMRNYPGFNALTTNFKNYGKVTLTNIDGKKKSYAIDKDMNDCMLQYRMSSDIIWSIKECSLYRCKHRFPSR